MFNLKIIPKRNGITWYNLDTEPQYAGIFDYHFLTPTSIRIIGYMKDSNQKNIKGVGYELIKMSIDYLLDRDITIFSSKGSRNGASNRVWEKLAEEYVVVNTTFKGCKYNHLLRKK